MEITVLNCQNLIEMDPCDLNSTYPCDPYVRIYVKPGNHKELRTKTLKNQKNPEFNEKFCLKVPEEEVMKTTVIFKIFDEDFITEDDFIGEVQVTLSHINDLGTPSTHKHSLQKISYHNRGTKIYTNEGFIESNRNLPLIK